MLALSQNNPLRIMKSSPTDSRRTLVLAVKSWARKSKGFTLSEGIKWEWGRKNLQFSAYKSPYLRNGARYMAKVTVTGSCVCPFDWCQNQRPWMTLKGQCALYCKKDVSFGAHLRNLNEGTPYYQRQKWLFSGDIRFMLIFMGFPGEGASTTMGLLTTAVFSIFAGCFFRHFRD